MIVVDNDVISYFWLEATRTEAARRARKKDTDWIAPYLWRSEFRSVLQQHMRVKGLPYSEALRYAEKAERDMQGSEFSVKTPDVLKLVDQTGHSAYDCEYVALAQAMNVKLVTGDRDLPARFPDTAVLLEDFAEVS